MMGNSSFNIAPPDPQWSEFFSFLGTILRKALGDVALRIDHIGSTAVPNLESRPVLDIQISVLALEPEEPYRLPLQRLGYLYLEGDPDGNRRSFRESAGERPTRLHIRRAGSWEEQYQLLFRDYLRAHPEAAKHHARLDSHLEKQYSGNPQGYRQARDPFIWDTLRKAHQWSSEVAWQPGASDA